MCGRELRYEASCPIYLSTGPAAECRDGVLTFHEQSGEAQPLVIPRALAVEDAPGDTLYRLSDAALRQACLRHRQSEAEHLSCAYYLTLSAAHSSAPSSSPSGTVLEARRWPNERLMQREIKRLKASAAKNGMSDRFGVSPATLHDLSLLQTVSYYHAQSGAEEWNSAVVVPIALHRVRHAAAPSQPQSPPLQSAAPSSPTKVSTSSLLLSVGSSMAMSSESVASQFLTPAEMAANDDAAVPAKADVRHDEPLQLLTQPSRISLSTLVEHVHKHILGEDEFVDHTAFSLLISLCRSFVEAVIDCHQWYVCCMMPSN